jgi:hypothetical protein
MRNAISRRLHGRDIDVNHSRRIVAAVLELHKGSPEVRKKRHPRRKLFTSKK